MIDRLSQASGRDVSRETMDRLAAFASMLAEENERQNLIARSTLDQLWERHLVDGAQLVRFANPDRSWCDVGSGPGLPGIVIAILTGDPITLAEPRRRRVEFLEMAVMSLGLPNATPFFGKVEQLTGTFDLITARAVASLPDLFAMASHLAHSGTKWVLPKGVRAKSELDDAERTWQGRFELVPSLTSPDASIVIAEGVQPRGKR